MLLNPILQAVVNGTVLTIFVVIFLTLLYFIWDTRNMANPKQEKEHNEHKHNW